MSQYFNGLGMHPGNLWRLSDAKTRSITAENPTGEKGGGARSEADPSSPARELGKGWKCSPCAMIGPGETYVVADIEGTGAVQSMWFAGYVGRDFILRIYWDDQPTPAVETPLPDFFGLPWVTGDMFATNGPYVHLNSIMVAVNPNKALNCFWEMPFRHRCRITIENRMPAGSKPQMCFYQVNYTLTNLPEDIAYFHAQFRRTNPVPYKEVYTIIDGIQGKGQYVGTSMGWGINNSGWWGEGEIKFYIDGDEEYPTICGTGTEDYFGGAFNWDVGGSYREYSTAYVGMHQVLQPDGLYQSQQRHAMYRWHVVDPIRFDSDLKVTIQALGWRGETRYYPGMHDICSVAYWYQTLPAAPFPAFPSRDETEIV